MRLHLEVGRRYINLQKHLKHLGYSMLHRRRHPLQYTYETMCLDRALLRQLRVIKVRRKIRKIRDIVLEGNHTLANNRPNFSVTWTSPGFYPTERREFPLSLKVCNMLTKY